MDTPHPHFPNPDNPRRDPVHLSSLTRLVERTDLPPGPDARVAIIDGATVIAVRPGLDRNARVAAVRQALARFRRPLLAFPILGLGWLRHHALAAGSAAAATTSAAVIAAVVVTGPAAVPPHAGIPGPLGPAPATSQTHQAPASQPARRGHTAPGSASPGARAPVRTHAHGAVPVPTTAPAPAPSGGSTPPRSPAPHRSPTPHPSLPLPSPTITVTVKPSPSSTHFPNLKACLKVYSLIVCIGLGY